VTGDGEYELVKVGKVWRARRRDSDRVIGTGRTLAEVMALAGRHYVTPVGQWDLPVCADCGEPIQDNQDVDYTLDTAGNVVTVLHTDAYHREMYPDDETGPSPYAYERQLAATLINAETDGSLREECDR